MTNNAHLSYVPLAALLMLACRSPEEPEEREEPELACEKVSTAPMVTPDGDTLGYADIYFCGTRTEYLYPIIPHD